jgi:hypothetical protein
MPNDSTIKFNAAGAPVTVRFASGVLISHWMARLITTAIPKQDWEGANDDGIPDEITVPAAALAQTKAILFWSVLVFAPGAPDPCPYKVTVSVMQDGKALTSDVQVGDNMAAGSATTASGTLTFESK